MTVLIRILFAAACANLVSGCISSGDHAYVVSGNPVNPTPVRGYRVECTTVPSITNFIFDDYLSGCRPVMAPVQAAISVRG